LVRVASSRGAGWEKKEKKELVSSGRARSLSIVAPPSEFVAAPLRSSKGGGEQK